MAKKKAARKRPAPRRAAKLTGAARRPVFEQWATMAPPDRYSEGRPRVCLWGTQDEAFTGVDHSEEVVCLVRVEVLEVLDEE